MTKFYIHGFNSNRNSSTFRKLKEHYSDIECIEWDCGKDFQENLKNISNIICEYNDVILFGSSMGGFYSLASLSKCSNIKKMFLFNPVIDAFDIISDFEGEHSICNVTHSVIESYPDFSFIKEISKKKKKINGIMFLGENDEILNYEEAYDLLNMHIKCIVTKDSHKFKITSEILNFIDDFIK